MRSFFINYTTPTERRTFFFFAYLLFNVPAACRQRPLFDLGLPGPWRSRARPSSCEGAAASDRTSDARAGVLVSSSGGVFRRKFLDARNTFERPNSPQAFLDSFQSWPVSFGNMAVGFSGCCALRFPNDVVACRERLMLFFFLLHFSLFPQEFATRLHADQAILLQCFALRP